MRKIEINPRLFLHIILLIKNSLQEQIDLMAKSWITNAVVVTRVRCI